MFENKEGVTHIGADGKWAVTGSRQSIKLWDLEEHKLVESVKSGLDAFILLSSCLCCCW